MARKPTDSDARIRGLSAAQVPATSSVTVEEEAFAAAQIAQMVQEKHTQRYIAALLGQEVDDEGNEE